MELQIAHARFTIPDDILIFPEDIYDGSVYRIALNSISDGNVVRAIYNTVHKVTSGKNWLRKISFRGIPDCKIPQHFASRYNLDTRSVVASKKNNKVALKNNVDKHVDKYVDNFVINYYTVYVRLLEKFGHSFVEFETQSVFRGVAHETVT